MCTRYVLLEEHYRAVLARLGIAPPADAFASRYNIGPGTTVPALRATPAAVAPEPVALHWGLIAPWARTPRDKLVNTRAETLATKPYFQRALRSRRCVLPASGFYEWQSVGRAKQPWLFRWSDHAPFALAGIWERTTAGDGAALETCAVITTDANERIRPVHDRMPVMLSLEQCEIWLDAQVEESDRLLALLRPLAASELDAITVSPRMNSARVDDPSCIAPAPPISGESEPQLSLGF